MTSDPREPAPGAGERRVAVHGIVYVAGTALQGLGVLLAVPFITRTLGQAEYGSVSTALVVVQLVGVVAAAGLPQVILREHHRGPEGPRRARVLAGVLVVVAGLVLAVGLAVAGLVSAVGGAPFGHLALVVLASAALAVVVAGQSLMRARSRPGAFLVIAVGSTVCAQVAGLLAARVEPSATAFLAAYSATVLLAGVLGLVLSRPVAPWRDRAAALAGLRVSAPLLPHAVAMLVLLMGDVLVVSLTLGVSSVATYQVALQLGNVPFVLVTALVNAWAPAVFARPAGERWAWTERTGAVLAAVAALGAAGVALLAPWVVAVAAPASFDRDLVVHLVGVFVLVAPLYLLYNGAALAVIDRERTGRLAAAATGAAAVLIVSGVALALAAGVVGVSVARVLGYLTLVVATSVLARRAGLRWRAATVAPVLAVAGLAGLAGALLPATGWGAVVRLVAAVAVAVTVLVGARVVQRRVLSPSSAS